MELGRETIEFLQRSGNIPEIKEQLKFDNVKSPLAIIPNDMNIADLSKHSEFDTHYRAKYKTSRISDYIDYMEKNNLADKTSCFIDDSSMTALTIFDLGDKERPLHKLHTATLSLEKTSLFEAVDSICSTSGRKLSQKDLSDFFEEWGSSFIFSDKDCRKVELSSVINTIKDININGVNSSGFRQDVAREEVSSMNKIEAFSADVLPAYFSLMDPVYHGLPDTQINVKIIYFLSQEQRPLFKLKILRDGELKDAVANNLLSEITEMSKDNSLDGVNFYVGTMS